MDETNRSYRQLALNNQDVTLYEILTAVAKQPIMADRLRCLSKDRPWRKDHDKPRKTVETEKLKKELDKNHSIKIVTSLNEYNQEHTSPAKLTQETYDKKVKTTQRQEFTFGEETDILGDQEDQYHRDGYSSIGTITNRQSGELITNTLYNEYGEAALRLENEYGYRSEYHDQSNRIHLRAREYSTTIGRFLQEDTWYGKMEQPQSQNRYIYVENNPQKYRDRSGNAGWWSKAWNNVKKTVRNVWNGVKRVVNTVWNAIVPPAYRSPSSWSGVASGINYIGNYVARSYTPRRNYVGVNYIRGRNGQPVGYQTYNQALYYQSAAYRYQVQVQRAKATRMMATVRIKKACDTADKKWTGKNKGLVVGAAFVIPIPRVPVVPPVTMIPKPGLDIDSGNFSFPSLPKIPSARDIANGIVGWFIGDYIQKIAKDANKNTSIKPEVKYKGSKKHGVNWKEGPATAKSEGTPQGQWSNKDLDYASEIAKKLGARESGYFDLPPGSSSVVHKPDGSTVPAKRIWIRNNGTGTFHGYPSE